MHPKWPQALLALDTGKHDCCFFWEWTRSTDSFSVYFLVTSHPVIKNADGWSKIILGKYFLSHTESNISLRKVPRYQVPWLIRGTRHPGCWNSHSLYVLLHHWRMRFKFQCGFLTTTFNRGRQSKRWTRDIRNAFIGLSGHSNAALATTVL